MRDLHLVQEAVDGLLGGDEGKVGPDLNQAREPPGVESKRAFRGCPGLQFGFGFRFGFRFRFGFGFEFKFKFGFGGSSGWMLAKASRTVSVTNSFSRGPAWTNQG